MSHPKPFHRNYRGFVNSPNSGYSQWAYIIDRGYAESPEHYVRAFLLIQDDLQRLFEFVEPSDCNLQTYSYRIHELLMRSCIEVEANFKAILKENIYNPTNGGRVIHEKDWNIQHYKIINKTHHLSSYKVHVPILDGNQSYFEPFKEWGNNNSSPPWYKAYNNSKHDRKIKFKEANLSNLMNSIAGLLVVLSSQFKTETFSPGATTLAIGSNNYYPNEPALGEFFRIEFPNDWTDDEKYDFNWSDLRNQSDRFQKIDYNSI